MIDAATWLRRRAKVLSDKVPPEPAGGYAWDEWFSQWGGTVGVAEYLDRAADRLDALERGIAEHGLVLCRKVDGGCVVAGPGDGGDLFVARLVLADGKVISGPLSTIPGTITGPSDSGADS